MKKSKEVEENREGLKIVGVKLRRSEKNFQVVALKNLFNKFGLRKRC